MGMRAWASDSVKTHLKCPYVNSRENVPCSGCYSLICPPRLAARDAGRPERSGGRPESLAASRIAACWTRARALTPRQYSRPTPTPNCRQGCSAAGSPTAGGFGALGSTTLRAGRSGKARQRSFLPRCTNCTRPSRSVRTTTFLPTKLKGSCSRST